MKLQVPLSYATGQRSKAIGSLSYHYQVHILLAQTNQSKILVSW